MTEMRWRTRTVRGVPMRWGERQGESGDGPPVVLIHGIPTGPLLWRHVVPLVDARCLAFEMVGYAESIPAGTDRDLSLRHQADYLLAWLDDLGIEQAVLAGHDLGGGVAHIAAIREPARCAGLVLTNAVGYDSWPIPSVKALRAVSPMFRLLPDQAVAAVLAALMPRGRGHDNAAMARESAAIHLRPYLRHDGAAALARQVDWLDVADTLAVADRIRDLDVPARVVWGVDDQFQKVAYGHRFAWDLGTELIGIPGGKHFTPEDHPDVVADAVRSLVSEC